MSYKKPKRFFEKSGIVDPRASYYVQLENVTNMDNQDEFRRYMDQLPADIHVD